MVEGRSRADYRVLHILRTSQALHVEGARDVRSDPELHVRVSARNGCGHATIASFLNGEVSLLLSRFSQVTNS